MTVLSIKDLARERRSELGARQHKAPMHLQAKTRAWWTAVVSEFELHEHHVRLLTLAAESWDRCEQARRLLKKHGLVYTDKNGDPRPRPEVGIERDSRISFCRLLRELALDVVQPDELPQPPPIRR